MAKDIFISITAKIRPSNEKENEFKNKLRLAIIRGIQRRQAVDSTIDRVLIECIAEELEKVAYQNCINSFKNKILECFPDNWLDPLLTGKDAILGNDIPWGCPDIEKLIHAIKKRVIISLNLQ